MDASESTQQKLDRVTGEIGAALKEQARDRWGTVRTAKRSRGARQVWRFRTGGGHPDRYLALTHRSMVKGQDPTATLLAQLREAHWLDRMQAGPETSFMLMSSGLLRARTVE